MENVKDHIRVVLLLKLPTIRSVIGAYSHLYWPDESVIDQGGILVYLYFNFICSSGVVACGDNNRISVQSDQCYSGQHQSG